jgi:FkbM family methyltransferase
MNVLLRSVERLAAGINGLRLWRRQCPVWGMRLWSASFERWLYLRLHRLGCMGMEERAVLRRIVQPGMTVLDVGANLGLYTVFLSRLVGPTGQVVAFEPDPSLFALLQRNCALNGCTNITAHNLALGSHRDRVLLHRMILNSGDNTLAGSAGRHFRQPMPIEVVAADELLLDLNPDLIKIDVQGWEFEVLRGMERLLSTNPRATVYFELWPGGLQRAGSSPDELEAWLRARDYRLELASTGSVLDERAVATLVKRLPGLKHADLLAIRPPVQT